MASETLSLFPSPVCSIPPKSCLRQAEEIHARRNTPSPVLTSKPYPAGKLRGLALQLTPQVNKSASVQSPDSNPRPSFSSPVSALSTENSLKDSFPLSVTPASSKKRPAVAIRKMSIDTTSSDTRSDFSGPTLVRSNSGSSAQPKLASPPIKSMFPEYDPSLPLSQQRYYPTETLPRPSLERRADYHQAALADIPSPTSPVPAAGLSQLQALWNAASGQKWRVSLGEYQVDNAPRRNWCQLKSNRATVRVSRRSHVVFCLCIGCLKTGIVPVAQIDIATLEKDSKNETIVFPQQAALAALEAAATTHRANTIAQYDPRASSPQAAQLAFDAVAEAKAHESCQLILIPQGVNGYGIEEHNYELRHPRAGVFIISVDGIFDFTKQSNARITLYQPTNPEKSLSKPSKLVCFDLGTGTLDIDVASFRRLHSRYMIDSAICAVLAIAFAESRLAEAKAKSETFAGPPLTTKKDVELSKRAKGSRWRRSLGKKKSKQEKIETEKLPGLTRGILYLLGFSFEAIVWLLGLGVKVLSKVILCASGTISKK
ncbi:hypothetical protein D6D25_07519 [Aureobasidium pullulans]|nr:hypothetical protein D6D25_07519 [Aureobasidium pullulans]